MQELEIKKKEIVNYFLKKNFLVSQDLLDYLEKEKNPSELLNLIQNKSLEGMAVINDKIKEIIDNNEDINFLELEKLKTVSEKKGQDVSEEEYSNMLGTKDKHKLSKIDSGSKLKVVFSYEGNPKKMEAKDFTQYFNIRYKTIEKILKQRQELVNTLSISRIVAKSEREQISVIGMVTDKRQTKNGNYILTIEDKTNHILVLINKNKPDLFKMVKEIVLDEVIGVVGVNGDKIIFASNLLFPDTPLTEDLKTAKEEGYALFLSDLHVGSKNFLLEDFNKFLKWINCDLGSETQKQMASKVKYIIIAGDLVDGCGVYPGQDKELEIKDIKDQYRVCAELLDKIPKNIKMVICPGNHDAMRLAEPQPPIYRDFAEPLYNLSNVTMVSNPAIINIHSSSEFSGLDVLIYHGYSFDFYVAEVESIRNRGGYDRADLLMKFLLQKRHLAPSYSSNLCVPDTTADHLAIKKIPDIFVSGHIHKSAAANYRNVTLISGSCWQSKTAFQEKVGHNPEPSRVPLVNLQTREIKMLKFGNDK